MKFLIPADKDKDINLNIKPYVRGTLVSGLGNNVDASELTAVTNNFLHSLFGQYNVVLNCVTVTQASEH